MAALDAASGGMPRHGQSPPEGASELPARAERVGRLGSWEWDVAANEMAWSENLFRILGLNPRAPAGTFDSYLAHVHPDDWELVRSTIARAVRNRAPFRFEHRVVRPDGAEAILRCQGEPVLDPEGKVERVVGVAHDITELAAFEADHHESDARFRSAFENAPIGIAIVDFREGPDGLLIQVNPALCELTGRTENELLGTNLVGLAPGEDAELDLPLRERLIAGELSRYSVEKRVWEEKRLRWLEFSVSRHDNGGIRGIVHVQDVTERKRSEEQLRYIADHDSLTGLVNRRRFREELDAHLALQRRYGGESAVFLLDVDHLKEINDSRGHVTGDQVLSRVADVMRRRLRSTDVIGRLAGDEFAVLLPRVAPGQAEQIATELIERLAATRVAGTGVSVSIGIAPLSGQDVGTPDDVIALADTAMYRAKQGGGGVPAVSLAEAAVEPAATEEAPTPAASGTRTQAESLRAALEEDRLVLYGQPVVALRSGEPAHIELLVRARDEAGTVLRAGELAGLEAEAPGLWTGIDRWVVGRAIELLAADPDLPRVHVNVSAETLGDPQVRRWILDTLAGANLPAGRVAFEVDERTVAQDVEIALAGIRAIAGAGHPVVLDNFSGGFGSFEYLQRLPLDQVKIAGDLIAGLLGDEADHATIGAIVRLAQGTGTTTVAKLVEVTELIPILRMFGIDQAQGFGLHEPQPIAA